MREGGLKGEGIQAYTIEKRVADKDATPATTVVA